MWLPHSRVPPHGPISGCHPRAAHPRVLPQGPRSRVPPQDLSPTFPVCHKTDCNLSLKPKKFDLRHKMFPKYIELHFFIYITTNSIEQRG